MKIVFLDRDGVINKFPGNGKYVTKIKDFHFIPGSLEALRKLTEEKYVIFVVSNQAGVGKGVFTKTKLDKITKKMLQDVRKEGGKIKKVFYSIRRSNEGCQFRKPNIGAVRMALKSMAKNIRSARHAYFVGDTESDILAGHNAGCKTIFVLSGREDRKYMQRWDDVRPDYVAKNFLDATKIILGNGNLKKYEYKGKLPSKEKQRIEKHLKRRASD